MNDTEKKEFGEYIKRLREERGLSLREVEKQVGISNSYLYQIERGDRNPPKLEVMQKLATMYEVPFDSLLAAAKLQNPGEEEVFYDSLENAFQFVRRDRQFKFGTHMNGSNLTPEAKRFVVEVYQEMTGLNLLDKIKKGERKIEEVE